MNSCKCLSEQYEKDGNYNLALKFYKNYTSYKDSLQNDDNLREFTKREMQFQFDKTKLADSLQKAEDDRLRQLKHEQEIQQQTIYTYTGAGGFILMLGLAFVLYRGYRNKQKNNVALEKKNEIITEQKSLVDEKNKEIIDSIQYAKRLQEAILPPLKSFKEHLPDSFVFYQPKDIVAGDFYWMHILENKTQHKIFIAAADCTGHGVPGAMVSVVCSTALNRTLDEFKIYETGKVLDKVSELVEETFSKSEKEVKDGMDISLCCIDLNSKNVSWSGANNSLYILKKENSGKELAEVKADKQPIGFYENRKLFTTHSFPLSPGDILYLFTDGYADQFGGEAGKKFKYSKFKELLLEIHDENMERQGEHLQDFFNLWKGNFEQVDDVCVIGIRI